MDNTQLNLLKQNIDLTSLIKSRGVKLRKRGKDYKGRCPFHDDKRPSLSVNLEENLWNCFGCDAGGDAIRFVELYDRLDFQGAVEKLAAEFPAIIEGKNGSRPKLKPTTQLTSPSKPQDAVKEKKGVGAKAKKLLARVVDYYQHTFKQDSQGQDYLKARGIQDKQSLVDFQPGFVNGSLRDILPADKEITRTLEEIGILNKKGNEVFYHSVVFPLYDSSGAVVNLYGRNIGSNRGTTHLYLPGSRQGLVNRQAAKRSDTLILTESIIDALTLYDQGFKNVIPVYGTNGLTEEHLSLFNRRVKTIYLVFDNDEAGKTGMSKAGTELRRFGIQTFPVELPVKDVNLYFQDHTPEQFEALLKAANPASNEQSEKLNQRKQTLYKSEENGFIVGYGQRQYQIKGIQRGETQLKATIKVSQQLKHGNHPFELSTIDLYSSRSRLWFGKLCADLLEEKPELVKEDLSRILALIEEWQPDSDKPSDTEMSEEEESLGLGFLRSNTLFSDLQTDFATLGVTGEETNKLVGYLAASSRKLAEPLSLLIQSRSAAGKSTLQDAILSLIPEEDYTKYTRMTDQALFYQEENALVNKVLAIEEAEGMGGAAYSIRNIQSAKQITVAATAKDPGTGKMKTEEYTVRGPVCVMITTTATEIDQETASRFIFLTIDESTTMTQAIHQMQREAESLAGLIRNKQQDVVTRKHHAAQRLLKNLAVVNPYAQYLSYPSQGLRSRRDHKKYLGLIRAIAFIHQYQREIKTVEVEGEKVAYVEVTLDDIEIANQLANEVLGQTMDELAKPSRTLLSGIYQMVQDLTLEQNRPLDEIHFTRRMIREAVGWTDWQIRTHLKQLEELEYIGARVGAKGKEYSYILNYHGQGEESDKCYLNLTSVAEIKKLMKQEKG